MQNNVVYEQTKIPKAQSTTGGLQVKRPVNHKSPCIEIIPRFLIHRYHHTNISEINYSAH